MVSRTKRALSCGWARSARSARSVRVSAMLHTVDQNHFVVVEDLVDDAIVATPR
jgi:hypothetical protein